MSCIKESSICVANPLNILHFRPELNSGREDLKMQGEGRSKHVHLSDLWKDDDGQDKDEEAR